MQCSTSTTDYVSRIHYHLQQLSIKTNDRCRMANYTFGKLFNSNSNTFFTCPEVAYLITLFAHPLIYQTSKKYRNKRCIFITKYMINISLIVK